MLNLKSSRENDMIIELSKRDKDERLNIIPRESGEEWAIIDGYENYAISTHGRVFSFMRTYIDTMGRKRDIGNRIMTLSDSNAGYNTVRLTSQDKSENKLVHRLVANAFLENPNKYIYVNHKDGNKKNNNIKNLEWCSPSHNNQHAHDNGLIKQSKKVLVIQDDQPIGSFISLHDAGRRLNIPFQTIAKIIDTDKTYGENYKFTSVEDNDERYIFFSRLREDAIIPSRSEENGGYDIYCVFDEDEVVIKPGDIHMFNSGISSVFSTKYVMIGYERGSTGTKGMAVRSMVIDSGYRGEWLIPINNTTNKDIIISKKITKILEDENAVYYPYNKAICQAVLTKLAEVNVIEVDKEYILSVESERGSGKLGSSGK